MELLLPCIVVGDTLHLDNQLEEERAQQQSQRKRGEGGSNVVKMAVKEPVGQGRERKQGDCHLQSRTGPGHLMEECNQAALGPGGGEDGVIGQGLRVGRGLDPCLKVDQ